MDTHTYTHARTHTHTHVYIQSKLLYHTFVMGASSDLGQPFRPR